MNNDLEKCFHETILKLEELTTTLRQDKWEVYAILSERSAGIIKQMRDSIVKEEQWEQSLKEEE